MFYFWNTETVHWICPIFTELLINVVLIPCVQMGKSFRYLGRFFDFNMSNNQHMSELSSLVQNLMNDIDIKPPHPKYNFFCTVAMYGVNTTDFRHRMKYFGYIISTQLFFAVLFCI